MIEKLINKLYSFFNEITLTSINYVTWTSTVVVALLALTTIIFSQYNERQIIKSNDISKRIKDSLARDSTSSISVLVDELIHVLSNQSVYRWTLKFFFVISYVSCLIWIISGIGYSLIPSILSTGDLIIILLSLSTVICTFGFLPIILIQFNNRPPINIDNKNRISYKAFLKYFKAITPVSEEAIIYNYVNPSLEFSLSQTNKMTIALKQQIPISNVSFVFKLVGEDNQIKILNITNMKNEKYVQYSIKSQNKNENSFRGLFNNLSKSKHQHLFVFSKDKKVLIATYKMTLTKENSNLFFIKINNSINISPDNQVKIVLKTKSRFKFHAFSNSDVENRYRLIIQK